MNPKHTIACFKKLHLLLTLLISVFLIPAYADNLDEPAYSLKGFASLVATRTTDQKVGWRVQNQPIDQASSHAGKWALNAESLFGAQLDLYPHNKVSGTVQMLAMNRSHGDIEPAIELAFLRWRPTPQWQIRVGRIWTPSFMNSETRYVGYANTTVRNTNYTLYQITNLNGADVRYQQPFGEGQLVATSYLGHNRYQLPNSATGQDDYYKLPMIFGGVLSWESNAWYLRSSYTKINLQRQGAASASIADSTVPQLNAAASSGTCAVCADEADKWANIRGGTDYRIATIAGKYSAPRWALSGEIVQRTTDSTFPDTRGADIEFNYLIDSWTLYADYLRAWTTSNNRPVFQQAQFAALNSTYVAGRIGRDIVTVGAKYTFSKNLSMRAEIARLHFDDPHAGVGFAPLHTGASGLPGKYHLLSVTIDCVF